MIFSRNDTVTSRANKEIKSIESTIKLENDDNAMWIDIIDFIMKMDFILVS